MDQKLVISACDFFMPEISQVIKDGDYPEVEILGFPSNCSRNSVHSDQITSLKSKEDFPQSDIVFIGSNCHNLNVKDRKIKVINLEQCFEFFINRETVLHFISKGYYLVTNGWLRSYEQNIRNWGFDEDTAKKFFQESMKGILLLDTKITGDYLPNLEALSDYMGLAYEILPVGLTYCKRYIDSLVFNWRKINEQNTLIEELGDAYKQNAEYSVIFNQLEMLVDLKNETKIIKVGFELLHTLFAPSSIKFISINNKKKKQFEYKGFYEHQYRQTNEGFNIEVYNSKELLGIFHINGILFPQYLEYYKKMGRIISQVFGPSIANARKFKIILEQRKQLTTYSKELEELNISKDKFFSIIAHDLKTPFNTIFGFSNLLLKSAKSEEFDAESNLKYSEFIFDSAKIAYELLENLLTWSRSQKGLIEYNPNMINLKNQVDRNINLLKNTASNKKIKLSSTVNEELYVYADREMVLTVIRNLVSNAIKFTFPKGEIKISAKAEKEQLIVSISDTGVGIDSKDIAKLFKIHEDVQTDGTENEQGTGLGLILCKEFIEKHKGKIWVESEEGKGSTFHFTLPKAKLKHKVDV